MQDRYMLYYFVSTNNEQTNSRKGQDTESKIIFQPDNEKWKILSIHSIIIKIFFTNWLCYIA